MNEREIALYALIDILSEKAYNNIVLRKTLNKNNQLSKVQRGFITELVNGTLRSLIELDYIINQYSNTPAKKMKPIILNNLRMAVYQIMYMDRVPDSAACNEAVLLAKKKGFKNLSGFVNGVLRNIARNRDNIKYPDEEKSPVEYLAVKYSYPNWIIEYWLEELDYKTVKDMCIVNNKAPKVGACINTIKTDKEELKKTFAEDNVAVTNGYIGDNTLYISNTRDLAETTAYKKGLFHIMDESSMVAVKVLNPKSGDKVIDVCAAPGGKSFYCAYIMDNKGKIISRDVYEHKLELMKDGIKRLGIDIIETQIADAAVYNKDDSKTADCVIVDAPCSGLGLVRKKPDIKYNKTMEDIEALAEIQREILKASQDYVKIGGTLVYSTCTVSKKENLDNVKWFCDNYSFVLEDITEYLPGNVLSGTAEEGYIQILPSSYDTDGFFIARFKRKG